MRALGTSLNLLSQRLQDGAQKGALAVFPGDSETHSTLRCTHFNL